MACMFQKATCWRPNPEITQKREQDIDIYCRYIPVTCRTERAQRPPTRSDMGAIWKHVDGRVHVDIERCAEQTHKNVRGITSLRKCVVSGRHRNQHIISTRARNHLTTIYRQAYKANHKHILQEIIKATHAWRANPCRHRTRPARTFASLIRHGNDVSIRHGSCSRL